MYDDPTVRTTLTIDPDVAELLRKEARGGRGSLKRVVNERLRMGFGLKPRAKRAKFRVEPHDSGFAPGVDPARLNQLADELEAMESARKIRRCKP